ncbi:4033_t:CDS:2 [Funneliformis geosporum]|nr:4033_t:CDS:2 [Funneliformis geosporum]
MDDAKWINLCNANFVKKFNNSELYDILEDWHISKGKAYLSKQWETIQKPFQILGFTGIDDMRTLSEIRNQSLLFFSFKSCAKETPDLKSAIKAINVIACNWCGYTIKSDKKE